MDNVPNVLLLASGLAFVEYLVIAFAVLLRRPGIASGAILSLLVVETWFITLPAIPAGISVYAADLVFFPLAIAGLARMLLTSGSLPSRLVVFTLFAVFIYSFARGAMAFGIVHTGVEARGDFYFLAALLYFSTFAHSEWRFGKVIDQWLMASTALTAIALFRWFASMAGLQVSAAWMDFAAGPSGESFRVLQAAPAMVVATGLFMSLHLNLTRTGTVWQRSLVYVLAPVVLILQHRTVWIACLVGLVWLVMFSRLHRRKLLVWLGTLGVVAFLLYIVIGDRTSGGVVTSLQASSTNTGTFEWRLEGWRLLLSTDQGYTFIERLFGRAYGSGYDRFIEGELVEHSPHNFYVQAFIRLGGVGLGLMVLAYAMGLRFNETRLSVPSSAALLQLDRIWPVLILVQLVYFTTYSPPYVFGIIIGVAVGSHIVSPHSPRIPSVRRTWLPAQ